VSDHSIVYDLQRPGNGDLECNAAPDSICHAVFDCDCEAYYGFHVVDGVPHHFTDYDGIGAAGHHVGRFNPDECALVTWHENSDEDVTGTVRVAVEPDWHEDYVEFDAVAAEVTTTRSPEGAPE